MNEQASVQDLDSDLLQGFMSLFRGRTDAWGSVEGRSNKTRVTKKHYQNHLDGKTSLGVYMLLDDATCQFFAVDLDERNIDKALAIRQAFLEIGINVYCAYSKGKGFHIYGFAGDEPFNAGDIRLLCHGVLQKLGISAEVFPKQHKLDEVTPLGNYINLPCFGGKQLFFNSKKEVIHLPKAIKAIKRVSNDKVQIALKQVPMPALPVIKAATKGRPKKKGKAPPCVESILKGVAFGTRDVAAFALARHYLDQQYTPEEVLGLLKIWDSNNLPPLDDTHLLDTKVSSAAKGYRFGCSSITGEPLLANYCAGEENCEWWNKVDKVLQGVESGQFKPRDAVQMLRELKKIPLHIIRNAISKVVIDTLGKSGRFIRNPEGRFYFNSLTKELTELDSFEFGVLLNQLFGLNQTEPEFKYTIADINTQAHLSGQQTEVHRLAYYDCLSNILYIDRFDGQMYRLNGKAVQLVDNSTDSVLFTKQQNWKPYSYISSASSGELLEKVLVDDIPFQRDSFAPLTPSQQRMAFTLWVFSLFFESLLPTKPILALIGEKGSGKTTALRRVLRLLFGPDEDVTGLEREREDAFVAAITHGYLTVFDNLDGKTVWINDRLAVAATGSVIQRRRLYTTNEVIIYRPKCFLAITSRNPQFKRDDVVDRLILLKVGRLQQFSPEREMLEEVDSQRDSLWTELIGDLNNIITFLGQINDFPKTPFRMSDWATLCWRIAELQGIGDEFDNILNKLSIEQSNFLLEDDPLYQCLLLWLEDLINVGKEVDAKILFAELSNIAESAQIDWSYKSTMSLAKRLNNTRSNLQQLLGLTVRPDSRGRTHYVFRPFEVLEMTK